MRTTMTARVAAACPGGAGLRRCQHGRVLPGYDRSAPRPRPAVGERLVLPRSTSCCYCGCAALSKARRLTVSGFRSFPALSTTNYNEINKRSMCSAYLSRIAARHVDKLEFPLYAQGVYHDLPGRGPVMGAAGRPDPQHFHRVRTGPGPLCTRNPHVVHTKPVAAQWSPRSVAGRSGRAGTARATARHPVLRGSTPMAWHRLASAAVAAQPARGSADPKASDSIRTNEPYLTSEVTIGGTATVSILARSVSMPSGGEKRRRSH